MNIAIIRHSIRNRGGDRVILDYLSYLISKGHQATYWTNEIQTVFQIHPKIGIKMIPIPGILGTIIFTLSKKFEQDVVLVDLAVMALFSSLQNRKKTIYLAQGNDVNYHNFLPLKICIKTCYHFIFRFLNIKTIAVSSELANKLSPFCPRNLSIIPNGVDLSLFCHNDQSPYLLKRIRKFVILLFTREDYCKGLDIAKKAIEKLSKIRSQQDWEIWTIGSETIEVIGAPVKNFGFLKTDEELKDILSASDIYLVPSRSEGLSLLLLQTLACECAIIGTEAVNIIKHEENGLVSPIENWEALAQNMNRLLNDKKLLSKLQKNGRLLAEQYSLEKSCQLFEQTLITFARENEKTR